MCRRLCAYSVVALLIWYSARGISVASVVRAVQHANLELFLPVSLGGFLVWFFGESLLFARLFSYFHERTTFREVIPANAAHYFLQLTNVAVASGALLIFLNRRKSVPWTAAGFTLLFQGFLDAILLAVMTLTAVFLGLDSPLRVLAPCAALIFLVGVAIAAYFLCWKEPHYGTARWLQEPSALMSFRAARLFHYWNLTLIRAPIFIADGFCLYGELRSFHVRLSLFQALLFSPVSLLVGSLPLAPLGLGTVQVVFVKGLGGFAPSSDLLATAFAISVAGLVWRILLGLAFARSWLQAGEPT